MGELCECCKIIGVDFCLCFVFSLYNLVISSLSLSLSSCILQSFARCSIFACSSTVSAWSDASIIFFYVEYKFLLTSSYFLFMGITII